jgi:hypothetical protein
MRLGDAILAEMEYRRRQNRTGMAFTHTCDQMLHAGQVRLGNEECDGCAPCSYVEVFR